MKNVSHYLRNFLCCQTITIIRTMMTIPRTPMMTSNVVSLSEQVHLISHDLGVVLVGAAVEVC